MIRTNQFVKKNLWSNFCKRELANPGIAFGDIVDFFTYTSRDFRVAYEMCNDSDKDIMEKNVLDFFLHFCYTFGNNFKIIEVLAEKWRKEETPFIIYLAQSMLDYDKLTFLSPALIENIWTLTDYVLKKESGLLQFINKENSVTIRWTENEWLAFYQFMRRIEIAKMAIQYSKKRGIVVFLHGKTTKIVECFSINKSGFHIIKDSQYGCIKQKYPKARLEDPDEVKYMTPQIILKNVSTEISPSWHPLTDEDPDLMNPYSSPEIFNTFLQKNHIKNWAMVNADVNIVEVLPAIIQKKRRHVPVQSCLPEYQLHLNRPRLYQTEDKSRILVAHCYIGDEESKQEFKKELNRFAGDNGLAATLYEPAYDWYFHATSLVVIHQPFLNVYVASKQSECAFDKTARCTSNP